MSFAKIAQAAGLAAVAMYAVGCKDDAKQCGDTQVLSTDALNVATVNGGVAMTNLRNKAFSDLYPEQDAATQPGLGFNNAIGVNCWGCIFAQSALKDLTCTTVKTPAELKTLFLTTPAGECGYSFEGESEITFAESQPCSPYEINVASDMTFEQISDGSFITGTRVTLLDDADAECKGYLDTLAPAIAFGGGATQADATTFGLQEKTATTYDAIMTCSDYQTFFCLMGAKVTGSC